MLFKARKPEYTGSNKVHFLRQGYNMNLSGAASKTLVKNPNLKTFAVQPKNFRGVVPIPKVVVEKGDKVLAGDPLFYDKKRPELKFVAPVSGEISTIQRGQRRSIKEIVILADKEIQYKTLTPPNLSNSSREGLVEFLMESGAWPFIRQRPFNVVADKDTIPKNIFITTFDTAPLAPDLNFIMSDKGGAFQAGLDVLTKLTSGDVYLGLNANGKTAPSAVFRNAKNVKKQWFQGRHPSGNVGVQLHHIAPIRGEEKVWTLGVQDVAMIGNLFLEKIFDGKRIVALTGSELVGPKYIETYLGASIGELLKNGLSSGNVRIISGDVLSGRKKNKGEFLNAFDDQLTVIQEGNEYELFGWAIPGRARPSISRTFLNFLYRDREFKVTTNTRGGKRAFVVTGQYESVLPMAIFPQHLMKAIITGDIEKMEGLGIYELESEDIAICEFSCTSKQHLQKILREGQQIMIDQA